MLLIPGLEASAWAAAKGLLRSVIGAVVQGTVAAVPGR